MHAVPSPGELLRAALRALLFLRGGRSAGLALAIAWRGLWRDRGAERALLARLARLYDAPMPRRPEEAERLWCRMAAEIRDTRLAAPERRAAVLAVLAAGIALELAVADPSYPQDAGIRG